MKRRSFAKTRDNNEPEIIKALKTVGANVKTADWVDLIVGFRGRNYLIEVKNPEVAYKIEPSQKELDKNWRGQYDFAFTPTDALRIIGAIE